MIISKQALRFAKKTIAVFVCFNFLMNGNFLVFAETPVSPVDSQSAGSFQKEIPLNLGGQSSMETNPASPASMSGDSGSLANLFKSGALSPAGLEAKNNGSLNSLNSQMVLNAGQQRGRQGEAQNPEGRQGLPQPPPPPGTPQYTPPPGYLVKTYWDPVRIGYVFTGRSNKPSWSDPDKGRTFTYGGELYVFEQWEYDEENGWRVVGTLGYRTDTEEEVGVPMGFTNSYRREDTSLFYIKNGQEENTLGTHRLKSEEKVLADPGTLEEFPPNPLPFMGQPITATRTTDEEWFEAHHRSRIIGYSRVVVSHDDTLLNRAGNPVLGRVASRSELTRWSLDSTEYRETFFAQFYSAGIVEDVIYWDKHTKTTFDANNRKRSEVRTAYNYEREGSGGGRIETTQYEKSYFVSNEAGDLIYDKGFSLNFEEVYHPADAAGRVFLATSTLNAKWTRSGPDTITSSYSRTSKFYNDGTPESYSARYGGQDLAVSFRSIQIVWARGGRIIVLLVVNGVNYFYFPWQITSEIRMLLAFFRELESKIWALMTPITLV